MYETWLSVLPIIIYILLILLLIVGIFLGIKTIITVDKVEKVVDNVNDKMESLNSFFGVIDFTTDKLSTFADHFVDFVSNIFGKFLTRKKRKKDDEEEE